VHEPAPACKPSLASAPVPVIVRATVKPFENIGNLLYAKPWSGVLRFCAFTVLAVVIWKLQSKAIQDAIVWIAFLVALWRAKTGIQVWKNAAGRAVSVVFLYMAATIPFGAYPGLALNDLAGMSDDFAAVFAISILFNNHRRVESALFYSASAFTFILGYDLIRMAYHLRGELFRKAHFFEPFILNHSNVAAMVAGAGACIMAYFAWKWRGNRSRLIFALVGLGIDLAYLVIVQSRGPQMAFAGAVVLTGLFFLRDWRRKVIWAVAAGLLGAIGFFSLNPSFQDNNMRGMTGRDKVWMHTWHLAKERPLMGYGYGKDTFHKVFHDKATNPPDSQFDFKHGHQYWLFNFFQHGWIGLALIASAWLLVFLRLWRRMARAGADIAERMLPAAVFFVLVFIHLYGLGDWPDNLAQLMLWWLIPVALVITRDERAGV